MRGASGRHCQEYVSGSISAVGNSLLSNKYPLVLRISVLYISDANFMRSIYDRVE